MRTWTFLFQLNSVVKYKKTKTQNLFLNSRQQICKVRVLVTDVLKISYFNVSKSFMRRRKMECIHENVLKNICGWIWFQFLVTSMLNSQKNNVGRSADEILRDVSDVLDFRDCKAFLKVGIPAYLHEQQFLWLTLIFVWPFDLFVFMIILHSVYNQRCVSGFSLFSSQSVCMYALLFERRDIIFMSSVFV